MIPALEFVVVLLFHINRPAVTDVELFVSYTVNFLEKVDVPIPVLPLVSMVKNAFVPAVVPSPTINRSSSSPPASSCTPIQKFVSVAVFVSNKMVGSEASSCISPVPDKLNTALPV